MSNNRGYKAILRRCGLDEPVLDPPPVYVHVPHKPRVARIESKCQRRARRRAIELRQARDLKTARAKGYHYWSSRLGVA